MGKKRLLWQLYPTYLFITLFALIAVGWYALDSLRGFYITQLTSDLEIRARLLQPQVSQLLISGKSDLLDRYAKRIGLKASMRMTVIDPSGVVLGDSHEDPSRMDNHKTRPEIEQAMQMNAGTSIRFSSTIKEKMMYLAIPVTDGGKLQAILRVSVPITFIEENLGAIELKIAFGGLVVALIAAGMSLWASRRISRPLEEMRVAAERFSSGDLSQMVPIADTKEIGGLGESLNQMAVQLDERIRVITSERNEREAVLSSMMEGVLAVDTEEKVISMNQAAAKIFAVEQRSSLGKDLMEIIRNSELQSFVRGTLKGEEEMQTDTVLHGPEELCLQVRGSVLRDAWNNAIGGVLVFNDVTRLRKLENIRRDFVANVSHELKTPITSIKGFVETLQDGAIDNPEDAKRFLEIIRKHTNRLNAIIEDLLSLSRLEQDSGNASIEMEKVGIKGLLKQAIQVCEQTASRMGTPVNLNCEEGLVAEVNPALIEQAVVNLLDNAIKYNGADKSVEIFAEQTDSNLVIRVRDSGCGISAEHLPRLFERFYRVDQARSRELGGTGLGLAIVKHITQVHRGSVDVQSTPGKGTVFSINLPIN